MLGRIFAATTLIVFGIAVVSVLIKCKAKKQVFFEGDDPKWVQSWIKLVEEQKASYRTSADMPLN